MSTKTKKKWTKKSGPGRKQNEPGRSSWGDRWPTNVAFQSPENALSAIKSCPSLSQFPSPPGVAHLPRVHNCTYFVMCNIITTFCHQELSKLFPSPTGVPHLWRLFWSAISLQNCPRIWCMKCPEAILLVWHSCAYFVMYNIRTALSCFKKSQMGVTVPRRTEILFCEIAVGLCR